MSRHAEKISEIVGAKLAHVGPCLPLIAWTGGSRPRKPSEISAAEASIQKFQFGQQVETFRRYWGAYPDRGTLRTFFNRARYDAHATCRPLRER